MRLRAGLIIACRIMRRLKGRGTARLANAWRTTGDIRDTWQSVSGIGFSQDRWAPFARPGHWNDPDMLVVGMVGWGTPHLRS